MPDADQVATYLADVKRDLVDGATYPHRVMDLHAPRLLAAVKAVLIEHEPIRSDGKATCITCSDSYGEHEQWPCDTVKAIARAVLWGETTNA